MEKPDAGLRGLDHCTCIPSQLMNLTDSAIRQAKAAHMALPTPRKAYPLDTLGNAVSGKATREDTIARLGPIFRRNSELRDSHLLHDCPTHPVLVWIYLVG